jgi:hypothetical protein
MKIIGFLLSAFLSINTFANPTIIADKINADKSCGCTGFPANLPVVALIHTSNWGTSFLKVFSVDDPNGHEKCLQLLKQLKGIEVCK